MDSKISLIPCHFQTLDIKWGPENKEEDTLLIDLGSSLQVWQPRV